MLTNIQINNKTKSNMYNFLENIHIDTPLSPMFSTNPLWNGTVDERDSIGGLESWAPLFWHAPVLTCGRNPIAGVFFYHEDSFCKLKVWRMILGLHRSGPSTGGTMVTVAASATNVSKGIIAMFAELCWANARLAAIDRHIKHWFPRDLWFSCIPKTCASQSEVTIHTSLWGQDQQFMALRQRANPVIYIGTADTEPSCEQSVDEEIHRVEESELEEVSLMM